ncbi:amino acid transporter, putative, partial [Perkinsus marinus ATCC 50983]
MSKTRSELYATTMVANPNGCSDFRGVANIVMTAVGVGVLALPNAVAFGGWVAAPLLLLLAWVLTHYQMCLLWKCLFMNPSRKPMESYEEIGRVCFGRVGQVAVALCLYGVGATAVVAVSVIIAGAREAVSSDHVHVLGPQGV